MVSDWKRRVDVELARMNIKSHAELCRLANVSQFSWSRFINGKELLSDELIVRVCQVLKIDSRLLFPPKEVREVYGG